MLSKLIVNVRIASSFSSAGVENGLSTGEGSRWYPKAAYVWRLYRMEFLGQRWSDVKLVLRAKRYQAFPKRLQSKAQWWWVEYWMQRYCALLDGPFRVGKVLRMGLGVFATKRIRKGSTVLFGQLHRVTHKAALRLDAAGETSLMQFREGDRIDWFYLGGPASLLNHACRRLNAEFVF